MTGPGQPPDLITDKKPTTHGKADQSAGQLVPEAATRDRRTEPAPDTGIYVKLRSLRKRQAEELAALTEADLAGTWQLCDMPLGTAAPMKPLA